MHRCRHRVIAPIGCTEEVERLLEREGLDYSGAMLSTIVWLETKCSLLTAQRLRERGASIGVEVERM